MNKINRVDALAKILKSNGKIFSVSFFKKDGSVRDMVCRLNVKKYLTTGQASTTAKFNNYVTVWEVNQDSEAKYRNINIDTLLDLNINKKSYKVRG